MQTSEVIGYRVLGCRLYGFRVAGMKGMVRKMGWRCQPGVEGSAYQVERAYEAENVGRRALPACGSGVSREGGVVHHDGIEASDGGVLEVVTWGRRRGDKDKRRGREVRKDDKSRWPKPFKYIMEVDTLCDDHDCSVLGREEGDGGANHSLRSEITHSVH